MSAYRCRIVKPERQSTTWCDVQAYSPEEAANEYHYQFPRIGMPGAVYVLDPDFAPAIHFALVEVEGHGCFVSKVYTSGIARRGGVKPRKRVGPTIAQIAKAIGWEKDPNELLDVWDGEQSE